MTNLIIQKNSSETLNPDQKTFHRLNQQIHDLKHKLDLRRNELETGSVFYCQHIVPGEKAIAEALTELTKVRYQLYKNRSDLKASDRKALKEVMLFETETILELSNPLEVDPEIEAILKKLRGKGHTDSLKELGEEMKEALEAMFKAQGMNVDLSEIDPLEPQEEVMRKIFEAFQQGASSREQAAPAKPKPQSEKQIKKQQKIDALKEAQKKGISVLYKQLARVIHPDLEQDPEQQIKKVELMKELTRAYENNDLLTLLDLEMQWINEGSQDKTPSRNQEQLKLYNSILREQVDILRTSIGELKFHPRYFFVQNYDDRIPLLRCLKEHLQDLQEQLAKQQRLIHHFGSGISLKNLRAELEDKMGEIYFSDFFQF